MADFFKVGAYATDTYSNIIPLQGFMTTGGNRFTFRKPGTTSGYQVTAGKTLFFSKFTILINADSSASACYTLGYADNDLGMNTATAPTNPVNLFGDTTVASLSGGGFMIDPAAARGSTVSGFVVDSIIGPVASQKYPFIYANSFLGSSTSFLAMAFEK